MRKNAEQLESYRPTRAQISVNFVLFQQRRSLFYSLNAGQFHNPSDQIRCGRCWRNETRPIMLLHHSSPDGAISRTSEVDS